MKSSALLCAFVLMLLSAGCGKQPAAVNQPSDARATSLNANSPDAEASSSDAAPSATVAPASSTTGIAARRSGELVNPEGTTMVMLYHDLAGVPVPLDQWVEQDSRVNLIESREKAERRGVVRGELESLQKRVHTIGVIRLSMQANLSHYDPANKEFLVRALSPGSEVTFAGFGRNVKMKLVNGRDAQRWPMDPQQAQVIEDQVSGGGGAMLEGTFRIADVEPAPDGGAILVEVREYDLIDQRSQNRISHRVIGPQ